MLILLLDEPGIFVFPTAEAATSEIEPIDAQSEIRAAFDATGVPYRVEWRDPSRANTRRGVFVADDPGAYQLVAAGPADPAALLALLEAHGDYTDPPDAHPVVLELRERLRAEVEGIPG